MRKLLLLMSLALAAGCGGGASDPSGEALTRARTLWQSQGLTRYAYTVRRVAFQAPETLGPWRVEVRNGVSTVTRLDGTTVDPNTEAQSVEAMFTAVEGALKQSGVSVNATYDPIRGFPQSVAVDPYAQMADDEWGYQITEFALLP